MNDAGHIDPMPNSTRPRANALPGTVPWNGGDVFLVVLLFIVAQSFAILLFVPDDLQEGSSTTTEVPQENVAASGAEPENEHPVVMLLQNPPNHWAPFIAIASAVAVAPLVEEFLFRVLLLGWLSKKERLFRGADSTIGWRTSWFSLVLTSIVFALMHVRGAPADDSPQRMVALLTASSAAELLVFAVVMVCFRKAICSTYEQLGWSVAHLKSDILSGLKTIALVSVPIIAMQVLLYKLISPYTSWAPDPIPLFFFSLVLGWLYLGTGRIVAPLVAHMGLNSISLVLLWMLG